MPAFNAKTAECLVFTFKEGLLSPIAHDLKIRVERFEIAIEEGEPSSVRATFDAGSLRVAAAMKDGAESPGDLAEADIRKIEDETRKAVLHISRFPDVRFRSRRVKPDGSGFLVEGELSLHGKNRTIRFPVRSVGDSWTAEVELHQPDFGIKPYKALLGTLKIKPNVTVRVTVPK